MTIFLTNYERIKNFSVEELANWLDEYGILDGSPWMNWFNDNYCNRCEPLNLNKFLKSDALSPIKSLHRATIDQAILQKEAK